MVSPPQIVNGYVCFDCADVALAQKGQNPAHPPGSVSNPTGNTPNGPHPLDGAKGPAGAQGSGASSGSGSSGGSSQNPTAVIFGGVLSGANGPSAPSPPPYQTGAQLSVFA